MRKPTAEYIVKLRQDLERHYEQDGKRLRDFRDLVKGRKSPGIPEKYRRVDVDFRLKDIDEQATRLTSLIAGNFPKLHVKPLDEATGDVANATKRETHTQAALQAAFRAAGGGNQWRSGVNQQILDGAGVFKMIPRRDMWSQVDYTDVEDYDDDEGYPTKRGAKSKYRKYMDAVDTARQQSGVPVVITTVDVDTWFPLWEDVGITASLEVTQRNTNATLKKYRLGIESDAKGRQKIVHVGPGRDTRPVVQPDTLTVIEYWDADWCLVVVEHQGEGEIAWEFEHHYGRIPLFPMWGRNFVRGNRRGESVLENLQGYQEMINSYGTIALNGGLVAAIPPVFHEVPEGSDFYIGLDGTESGTRKPVTEEKYDPGTRIMGRPGEKLTPLNLGNTSQVFKDMLDLLFKQMEKLSMPRAADAIAGDLEGAGFALNQILADLRAEKADVLDEQLYTLGELTDFYWNLIRNPDGIGDVVYIEAVDPSDEFGQRKALVKLGPSDLDEQVHKEWEIDWSQDAAKLVLVRMVHERIQAGTLDVDSGIRILGDDPDVIHRGRVVDFVRGTQQYLNVALDVVMQAAGRGDDSDMLRRAALMIEQQQGGQLAPPLNPAQAGAASVTSAAPQAMGSAGVSPDMGALAAAKGVQNASGGSRGAVRGQTAGVVVPNPRPGAVTT